MYVYKNWKECGRKLWLLSQNLSGEISDEGSQSLGQELGAAAISEVAELSY